MDEVAAVPQSGLTVVSTFAGCGGSALGYRMAGYNVVWANEFDAHAADCHELNDAVRLDRRDIRAVRHEEILEACGLAEGELDVLDGSPPCQTFSTAGRRRMADPRSDLFFEYARLLRGLRPRAFVAENVSGLLKGVAKGMFKLILRELKSCGYRVECRLLDAQWLGVPQRRQRAIFVGVREDLEAAPAFPRPLPYRYSVREACPWIGANAAQVGNSGYHEELRSVESSAGTVQSAGPGKASGWLFEPMATIQAGAGARTSSGFGHGTCRLPDDVAHDTGGFVRGKPIADLPCPTVTYTGATPSAASVTHPTERRKFSIAELRRIMSFPDDFRLTGSYTQQWRVLGNAVPPVMMRAIAETLRREVFDRLDGRADKG